MKNQSFRSLTLPLIVAVAAGLATAVLVAAPPLHRLANGLFVGGVVSLIVGLARLIRRLGMGDAFLFSHLRMSQVIRANRKKKRGQEEETDAGSNQTVTSFFDYLETKSPGRPWGPALLLGLGLMGLSFLCALAG